MRDIVIERIQASREYRLMREHGEPTPILNLLPNDKLLDFFLYCITH